MLALLLTPVALLLWALSHFNFPLTGEMLKEQANATGREEKPGISPKFLSIGKTEKEVTVGKETGATGHKFEKTSHGLVTKDFVVITELNGKTGFGETAGGLIVGFGYWVHEVSANEFAIAYTKEAAESATEGEWVEYTAAIKTTTKFAKVVELEVITAAVAKNRPEAKWLAANLKGNGPFRNVESLLETAVTIESNANSQEVKWLLGYSAISGGTLVLCEKAEEPFRTLQKGDKYEVPTSGSSISQLGLIK